MLRPGMRPNVQYESYKKCWSPVYAGYQLVGIDWNVDQVTEHWQRLPGQGRGGGPPGGDADGRGGGPGDGDDGRGGGPPDPGQGPSKKKPATNAKKPAKKPKQSPKEKTGKKEKKKVVK